VRETGSTERSLPGGGNFSPIRGKVEGVAFRGDQALFFREDPMRCSLGALKRVGELGDRRIGHLLDERTVVPRKPRTARVFCELVGAIRQRRLVFIDESCRKTVRN
jgi:hypothetical protein